MREQVERLEHDPDAPTSVVGVELGVRDVHTVEKDLAVVDWLEEVDASEEGRLARPEGPTTAKTSCVERARLTSARTVRSPNCFQTREPREGPQREVPVVRLLAPIR